MSSQKPNSEYPVRPPKPKQSIWEWLRSHPHFVRTLSVIVFFIIWEIGAQDANPLFIVQPTAIFTSALDLFQTGDLQKAFIESLIPLLIGLAISIVFGVLIGIALAQFWWIEYVFDPYLNALYAIPRIALVPLVILWAGLGLTGKLAILVSVAIFPVIFNTYAGIKDVRGALLEIGKAYCATGPQIFLKIILPASVPYIMAGIRLAVGLAFIGMIVAEFFTSVSGLGGLIVKYANMFETAKVLFLTLLIGAWGIAMTELVMFVEKRFSNWRLQERSRVN